MEKLKLSEIVSACRGSFGYNSDVDITDIVTSSKEAREHSVFIAIKGDRFDGHDFVLDAVKNGAECAVTERAIDGARCIIVDSARAANLSIANYYRKKFNIPFVAVTGSVGKTTTKDFIHCVLSEKYKTLKNLENKNNDIGVPETLFRLACDDEAAVIEMGMNHLGEISRLSLTAEPDICVITNIGDSHIGNLGSKENILRAKLEILDGASLDAPLIICGDDEYLNKIDGRGRRVIRYGVKNKSADVVAVDIKKSSGGIDFVIADGEKRIPCRINILGSYNVKNALAAYCVGCELGLSDEEIKRGIYNFEPKGIRQKTEIINGVTYILDCYNASPDSMSAGLELLDDTEVSGKRIAVLGDIKEVGDNAVSIHKRVGKMAAKSKADILLCIGDDSKNIAAGAVKAGFSEQNAVWFESRDELVCYLTRTVKPGDLILFKASRAMKLEEIASVLKEKLG